MAKVVVTKGCTYDLKRIRAKLNLSQERLAQALGCSVKSVSRWENNQPAALHSLKALQRLERVIEKLFGMFEKEEAERWLFSPNQRFDMKRPVDIIIQGDADRVLDILNRLEEGVHT